MTCRLISSGVASLLAASLCSLSVVSVSGQSNRSYAIPHTAWGDPDIQGSWSYNDDVDTPFERPNELGGKTDFGDEELAAVLEERAKRNVERAPTIGGETGAGPTHWYEFWNAKSTRTSKVIDPPDGRVPPLTAEARKRQAALAEALKGRGPSDSWVDRSLGDRCIVSRGGWPHVIVNAGSYGNIVRILQSPGYVVITHEMIHETRVIPVDGRPHISQGIRQYLRRPSRPLGRQHARRRGDELLGQDRLSRIAGDAASRRTVYASRR